MESKKLLKAHVIETLAYADIFDYPMTEDEIMKWLIGRKSDGACRKLLGQVNGVVFRKDGFLYLSERDRIVSLRKHRQSHTHIKLDKARRASRYLSLIPTITLLGISGSLAMKNAEEHDDIDFFIVARPGTLWLTRLLSIITLELLGIRRRPKEKKVEDKICLNMLTDENHLQIPSMRRNLYTAHEVCQLQIVFDKNNVYQKFLRANGWVKEYLPNATRGAKSKWQKVMKQNTTLPYALGHLFYALEFFAKSLQLSYMKIRNQEPLPLDGILSFYPKQYHKLVLTKYKKRLKTYGL